MSSWIGSGFDISNIGNGGIGPTGPTGPAGPSNSSILVYRPGGINQGNIYNTWGGIISAFQAMPGHVEIIVEDTYGVVNIDTSFDFENRASITGSNTTVSNNPYYRGTKVNINNGVTIKGITKFKSCFLLCNTTTSASINYSLYPSSSSSRSIYLQLEDVTIDATSSNYPVINLNTSGLFSEIHFYGTCYLASNISNPVIRVNGGEYLYLLFLGESGVYSSAISGSGNLYISRSVKENSFQTQTNFTGTLDISTSSIWGAFSANFKGDVVTYKQHPYTAINYNYAISPTNTTYWKPSQGNVLIFQPGGVDYGNVYTNWADVLTAFTNTPGYIEIVFDDRYSSIQINTSFDFQNRVSFIGKDTLITYDGIYFYTGTKVTINSGIKIRGISLLKNLFLLCDTTTSSSLGGSASGQYPYFMDLKLDRVYIGATSSNNPAIVFESSINLDKIRIENFCVIGGGYNIPIISVASGRTLEFYVKDSRVYTNTIIGSGTLSVIKSSSLYFDSQPNFTGTINYINESIFTNSVYNSYFTGDVKTYNNHPYQSIKFNPSMVAPTNTTYWKPAQGNTIVYQPGGTDYNNVYTNWNDVLTTFANTPGVVTIVLDGSFNSGIVQGTTYTNLVTIPTGYDFQNRVIFQAGKTFNKTSPTFEPIVISTSPGVQLKGVSELFGGLWLCDTSTSSCFVSPAPTGNTGYLILRITGSAFVVSTSTNNAAIKPSNFCQIILDNGYLGGDGGDKPVLNTNGISNYIYIKNGGYIDQPTSAFTGTGSLYIYIYILR